MRKPETSPANSSTTATKPSARNGKVRRRDAAGGGGRWGWLPPELHRPAGDDAEGSAQEAGGNAADHVGGRPGPASFRGEPQRLVAECAERGVAAAEAGPEQQEPQRRQREALHRERAQEAEKERSCSVDD